MTDTRFYTLPRDNMKAIMQRKDDPASVIAPLGEIHTTHFSADDPADDPIQSFTNTGGARETGENPPATPCFSSTSDNRDAQCSE
jgi:hypothetical protein